MGCWTLSEVDCGDQLHRLMTRRGWGIDTEVGQVKFPQSASWYEGFEQETRLWFREMEIGKMRVWDERASPCKRSGNGIGISLGALRGCQLLSGLGVLAYPLFDNLLLVVGFPCGFDLLRVCWLMCCQSTFSFCLSKRSVGLVLAGKQMRNFGLVLPKLPLWLWPLVVCPGWMVEGYQIFYVFCLCPTNVCVLSSSARAFWVEYVVSCENN